MKASGTTATCAAPLKVGLLGCGTVGASVVRGLDRLPWASLSVVAVRDTTKRRDCELPHDAWVTTDATGLVEHPAIDVVVEAFGGLDPASGLLRRALAHRKPVVTANKAVIAAHGLELAQLATQHQTELRYEAAVAGAIPAIRTITSLAATDTISSIEGVLNGTTTFVLSWMEATGCDLIAALAEARRRGLAEADPTRDLDGTDSADKLAILARHGFGRQATSDDVPRMGIDWITPAEIRKALANGRRWRLVATAVAGACLRVEPVALPLDHPFARLDGPANALTISSERAGTLTLSGPGAGGDATASAILTDLADLAAHRP